MKRIATEHLKMWKERDDRKPLIIRGARQVGKTWLMKEFGKDFYESALYFNFDEEDDLKSIFESNKNPQRIIELLGLIRGTKIEAGKTLIILDEIQECPPALNALKYFHEKANEYHIITAGSLLGTLLAQPKTYPVGQVNLINIYPLAFDEFLMAVDPILLKFYLKIDSAQNIEEIFHNKLLEVYNLYLIVGGMPECVRSWIENKDARKILELQRELVTIYENDFAKHSGKVNSARILMVFRSIVSQLAKENRKFIYGCVKEGARAREFEEAVEWLVSAGMLTRVYAVSKPEHPLPAFDRLNSFKLYLFDTGLLKCMAGIDNEAILLKSKYHFKGALTENFVLQQIRELSPVEPRFYAGGSQEEIDFVLQHGMEIIPIEVKSEKNNKSSSFKKFIAKYKPKTAIRYSKMNAAKDGDITNLPLYLAHKTLEII